jgi:methionyl-tRNA formyltransferase
MPPLRIVFMGTADLAATVLETLHREKTFTLAAAVSQPDKPKGRDLNLQPTPVKIVAQRLGLPLLQPARARDPQFIEQLRALAPDLVVVAAYGQILPEALLDIPPLGCLNVHTSLLPKYRGAAPIQWAILNGDTQTGVTIMKMDAGLDTGAILNQEPTVILPEDNAQTLHDRLARIGSTLLVQTIPMYARGEIVPRRQPAEGVSYARKITREDARLDWSQPATVLSNKVRGLTPWPGTFTFVQRGTDTLLLKIWRAEPVEAARGEPGCILSADRTAILVACGNGALKILELQREGGKRLDPQQFLSGTPLKPGDRLTNALPPAMPTPNS